MPSEITSMPCALLSAIFCSSWANRYGGIFSRRLLGFMKLLDEFRREHAAVHGHRPAGQVHVQVLPDLDLQVATVQVDGDRRVATAQDERDSSAARAGAGREH